MFRRLAIALVTLFLSSAAFAQVPTNGNIFFGYSYNHASGENLNGWNGSLEGKIFPFVGLVADVSGQYGSHDSIYSAIFGPRVSMSVGRLRPFVHVLVGISRFHSDPASDTSFSDAFGGGVDIKLIPMLGWRFQADDLQTRFFGGKQDDFRFSTGLTLHF